MYITSEPRQFNRRGFERELGEALEFWADGRYRGCKRCCEESRHGTQECVRHGGGAWVRFFIFCLGLRGLGAFGRRCYLDAPVWFRRFGWLGFGFPFLGFGGFLLQLAEGAVGALVHARETGFIAVTQIERSGFLG